MSQNLAYTFPKNFIWGSATASFQIEGASTADGKGPSTWDTFCKEPGRITNDDTGDVAIDFYNRYPEDIALLKEYGLKHFRLSTSWPRIIPNGSGAVNEAGLDFYDRVIDCLLEKGITPWVTLFHWDTPQALQDTYGAWLDRRIVDDFRRYVEVTVDRLSDRVQNWYTINEFQCFIDFGYDIGKVPEQAFAPGLKVSKKELYAARHYALLAHGAAVNAIREKARLKPYIGIADNPNITVPIIETPEHIDAARKAFRDGAHYLTAIHEGAYSAYYQKHAGDAMPDIQPGDMELISTPMDFTATNMYAPTIVRAAENEDGYEGIPMPKGYPTLNMEWLRVGPEIAYWQPRWLKELWGVTDAQISENGCACQDVVNLDGEVMDTDRIFYLRQHLKNAQRACAEGLPLKGYFQWSAFDNFEWPHGYAKRFGMTYINYQNQERIPKASARYYSECIRANAVL